MVILILLLSVGILNVVASLQFYSFDWNCFLGGYCIGLFLYRLALKFGQRK